MGTGVGAVFGVAPIENRTVGRLPMIARQIGRAEGLLALVPDKGVVGEDGAVAAARGPHDEVVLLVVAGAVDLVEAAECRQDLPADQHAEPDGGRYVAELREQRRKRPISLSRRSRVGETLGQRQRRDRRVVRARIDEADHRIEPRYARHLGQRARLDHGVGIQQQKIEPAIDRFLDRAVHRLDEAEIDRIAVEPAGKRRHRLRQDLPERRRERAVARRVIVADDFAADPPNILGAADQRAEDIGHEVFVLVEGDGDQDGARRRTWPRSVGRRLRGTLHLCVQAFLPALNLRPL